MRCLSFCEIRHHLRISASVQTSVQLCFSFSFSYWMPCHALPQDVSLLHRDFRPSVARFGWNSTDSFFSNMKSPLAIGMFHGNSGSHVMV
jgi:hypothetical protein